MDPQLLYVYAASLQVKLRKEEMESAGEGSFCILATSVSVCNVNLI